MTNALAVSFMLLSLSMSDIFPCSMGMVEYGHASGIITYASLPKYAYGTTTYLTGSICPPKSGSYTLYCEGLQSVYIEFNNESSGEEWTSRCYNYPSTGNITTTLNGHMCYPFKLTYSSGCLLYSDRYANLSIFPPGGSQEILDSSYTMQCDYSDCLLDYYGSTCSGYCDVYCNGNGYCSNGTTGNGKCVCSRFSSDPFCENISYYQFPSTAQGLYMYVYENEFFDGDYVASTVGSFPIADLTFAYQSILIEGFLYIPQNGFYDFEVVSSVESELTINSTVYGALPDANACNTTAGQYTVETGKIFFSRSENNDYTYFKLRTRVGCPFLDHSFAFNWKYYRYYDNSESTQWESFPSRYFTNSK